MMDEPIGYTDVSPTEIESQVRSGQAILLDVRESDEWLAGHLLSAKFLPLSQIQEFTSADEVDLARDKTIYSYCKAGVRSVYASVFLQRLGFNCHPMQEGFADLVAMGLEYETGQ